LSTKWEVVIIKIKNETSAGGIVFKRENKETLWLICQHSYHKGWVFPKGLIGDKKENEEAKRSCFARS
jgi:8-oxo-dGTP pyrophosphatase MutT (NUDIX family)